MQAELVNTDVNYIEIACRLAVVGLVTRMPLYSVGSVARLGSPITQGKPALDLPSYSLKFCWLLGTIRLDLGYYVNGCAQ